MLLRTTKISYSFCYLFSYSVNLNQTMVIESKFVHNRVCKISC